MDTNEWVDRQVERRADDRAETLAQLAGEMQRITARPPVGQTTAGRTTGTIAEPTIAEPTIAEPTIAEPTIAGLIGDGSSGAAREAERRTPQPGTIGAGVCGRAGADPGDPTATTGAPTRAAGVPDLPEGEQAASRVATNAATGAAGVPDLPGEDRGTPRTTTQAVIRAAGVPGHPEDDPGDPEAVAKTICLRLLADAARPRAGLAAALARKGIPAAVAERVLDRLTEVGLIDDEAYAQSFVAGRHRHRALGAGALREELKRKGVDAQTAAAAVAVVDREAEYGRARALLERRIDSAMAHGVDTARRRLLGLLARRGYPADLAQQVVQEVMNEYGSEVRASWA